MALLAEEILAKLDPKTRQRIQLATSVSAERQKTPSIGLNMALKGGLGMGRQILLWGNKSAGKSSFCLQMPLGQIKTQPVTNSHSVTDKTPISIIRQRMKTGSWK